MVVEVDESPEAPHAIENETRVYVRTGNASNPYELAKVDLIIERFTRRRELQARRSTLVRHQALRASELMGVQPAEMAIEVIVGPPFPLRTLVDRDFVWNFGMEQTYRSGRFIPQEVVRRTNDGIAGVLEHNREYGDITQSGLVFWKKVVETRQITPGDPNSLIWIFGGVFHPIWKVLVCAARLYTALRYRGNIQIDVSVADCFRKTMPFLRGWDRQFQLDDFRCVERKVTAQATTDAERIEEDRLVLINRLLIQICWSFWQPIEPFPADGLIEYVGSIARDMGAR